MDYEDEDEAINNIASDASVVEMAKGVTVTLPGYAADAILDAAARALAQTAKAGLEKKISALVDQICDDAWRSAIFDRAKAAAEEYLSKPRQPTDMWGNPDRSKPVAAYHDQIPSVVENWLGQPVDKNGNLETDSYRRRDCSSRMQWMLRTTVEEPLKAETTKAVKAIEEQARKVVATQVGKFVAEQMAPSIDVKSLPFS